VETFVIRIWQAAGPSPGDDRAPIRGLIRHVRSGEERAFAGIGEIERFLRDRMRQEPAADRGRVRTGPRAAADPPDPQF
jgi:hypothetical protein